jgi:hypothetical protein
MSTVYCIVGSDLCLSGEAWAGWAQAFASAIAIFAAGAIATRQARRQYEDARSLQEDIRWRKDLAVAEALLEVAAEGSFALGYVKHRLGDLNALHRVAGGEYFDIGLIDQAISALQAIPLHEAPAPSMVTNLIALQANLREVKLEVDNALHRYSKMPESDNWEVFFKFVARAYETALLCERDFRQAVGYIERRELPIKPPPPPESPLVASVVVNKH